MDGGVGKNGSEALGFIMVMVMALMVSKYNDTDVDFSALRIVISILFDGEEAHGRDSERMPRRRLRW